MRVIGIDPGVAITGYGIIDENGSEYSYIDSGCVRTPKDLNSASRLKDIHDYIFDLVANYTPQALVVEKLFFSKNVRTAFQVGEARGVIILAAARCNVDLFEYTPLQVKQAVAGYGKAEKKQVQTMVQMLLKIPHTLKVDDEADALAVALCHLQNRRYHEALKGGKS